MWATPPVAALGHASEVPLLQLSTYGCPGGRAAAEGEAPGPAMTSCKFSSCTQRKTPRVEVPPQSWHNCLLLPL
eukprot:7611140-Pyramimonas_sp.AAC.1